MLKADLHLHSTISDGSVTVDKILELAKSKGLTHVAFTEHDTTEGHKEAVDKALAYGITAIPAIEISAIDSGTGVKAHILGYGYKSTANIEKSCKKILERRHENSLKQIAILQNHGCDISQEMLMRKGCIYKQHIMAHLVKTRQAEEMFGEFYKKTFKNGGICDFDILYMPVEEAVKIIADDGGVPVLAHPLQQNNLYLVEKLIPYGLRGLELNHPANPKDRHHEILELCQKHSLFTTGGSDFHGAYEAVKSDVGAYFTEILDSAFL